MYHITSNMIPLSIDDVSVEHSPRKRIRVLYPATSLEYTLINLHPQHMLLIMYGKLSSTPNSKTPPSMMNKLFFPRLLLVLSFTMLGCNILSAGKEKVFIWNLRIVCRAMIYIISIFQQELFQRRMIHNRADYWNWKIYSAKTFLGELMFDCVRTLMWNCFAASSILESLRRTIMVFYWLTVVNNSL